MRFRATVWPWGMTRHSHRRKLPGLGGRILAGDHHQIASLFSLWTYSVEGSFNHKSKLELHCYCLFIFFFMQHDIKRSVWKEEEWHVGLWTVSNVLTLALLDPSLYYDRIASSLLFVRKERQTLVLAGLLNVKTVGERCIKSACCIMMSSGRQGKPCWTTFHSFKHIYFMWTWKYSFDFSSSSFVCDNCLKKSGKTRKENKFSAKRKLWKMVKPQ